MRQIAVPETVLRCLIAVAGAAGEELATGLDDGIYEEDSLAGYSVAEIDDAIEQAGTLLEAGS